MHPFDQSFVRFYYYTVLKKKYVVRSFWVIETLCLAFQRKLQYEPIQDEEPLAKPLTPSSKQDLIKILGSPYELYKQIATSQAKTNNKVNHEGQPRNGQRRDGRKFTN